MFLIEKLSSMSITVYWYDPNDTFRLFYPYGAHLQWYLDRVYRGSTEIRAGTSYSESITMGGLTPGTMYTMEINGYAYDQYGEYAVDLGSDSKIITTSSRPAFFSWTIPKIAGNTFYVGADEWTDLTVNIHQVITNAGYTYSFKYNSPNPGDILTAARYNDLRAAIQSVPGYGYYIPQVSPEQIITAQQLNLLVSELNAIP